MACERFERFVVLLGVPAIAARAGSRADNVSEGLFSVVEAVPVPFR